MDDRATEIATALANANRGRGTRGFEYADRLMELYLVRHGAAEAQSSTGRDPDRLLTAEGIEDLQGVLRLARQAACVLR